MPQNKCLKHRDLFGFPRKVLTFAQLKEVTNGRGNKSSLFYFIHLEAFFIEEKLHRLLGEKFQTPDFEDCFLVGFELHKNNKLEVFVDSDIGINLDQCRQLSRYLESFIEEENWFGEKYTLEVSSPGLSKPLLLKRQYIKNIGRHLNITLVDDLTLKGELKSVTDNSVVLEEIHTVKVGKKKRKRWFKRNYHLKK